MPDSPEIWGGLECTINRVQSTYFDQLNYSGHRQRDSDISIFADLGFKKMRYPILWEHHQPEANRAIDWTDTENKLSSLRQNKIDVIAGLVHHGSGPNYVEMSNDSFAEGLAKYATEVAKKFPWINYYTPVNEPLTTARFCGLYGLWYPHGSTDASFCRLLVNECKATVLAMAEIRKINPNAKLVQTDDLGKVHSSPLLAYQASFENERRWLSYDLLCGRVNEQHVLWAYLIGCNFTATELKFFCEHPCPPDILGINYYLTSERYLDENIDAYPTHTYGGNGRHTYADVEVVRVAGVKSAGLKMLLEEAWERYHIPLAVTEVHLHCTREEQMRWLNEVWLIAGSLCKTGVPILAITPWALLGSFGWDKLLTQFGGNYEPGVFDLRNGYPRPTVLAKMIKAYSSGQNYHNEALYSPGWWHRASRICYGNKEFNEGVTAPGKLLLISGQHAEILMSICKQRCLQFIKSYSENEVTEDMVWARIIAGDLFEIRTTEKIDLTVNLNYVDIFHSINTALDLFLDEECGTWTILNNGLAIKEIQELLPIRYLAS